MTELAKIVTHYLEVIVKRTGLTGFDEMRAEIMSAAEEDERRLRREIADNMKAIDRGWRNHR